MTELRVLLIDDSEDEELLLVDELHQGGYQPALHRVQSGPDMRRMLQEQDWDLLIVDYVMPQFSAPAAMALYRELDCDLPFIVVSGEVGEETAVEMMLAGAHDYISKHNRARLLPAIARELKEAEQRRGRLQAEAEVRQVAEQNRLILDSAGEGIFGLDREGKHSFVNPAAAAMLGYSVSELIGRNGHLTWHYLRPDGSDYPMQECAIQQALLSGEIIKGEEYFIRRNGEFFPVEFVAKPILDNGQVSGAIISFLDVTERKKAESILLRTNRALSTISQCNQTLIRSDNEQVLLQGICRVLEQAGGYPLAWVGFTRAPSSSMELAAWGGRDSEFLALLQGRQWLRGDSTHPAVQAAREGRTIIIDDLAANPRSGDWRTESLKRGYAALIALPLRDPGGILGTLNVCADAPHVFSPEELELLEELAGDMAFGIRSIRTRREHERMGKALELSLIQTIEAIALMVEKRDPYTAGHQKRVAEFAAAIATRMGLGEERIQGIRIGGSIHDVGKIHLPAEILNRPGRLTDAEFQLIRTHCQVGYDIIKDVRFPWPIARMLLQHHERLDGSGYPAGLKGEDILLEARILAVADVVEAITSHRPYRAALPLDTALEEIVSGRGSRYDIHAVDSCLQIIEQEGLPWND